MIREIVAQFQNVKSDEHMAFISFKLYVQSFIGIVLTSISFTNIEMWVRILAGISALFLSLFTIYKMYLDIKIRRNILNGKTNDQKEVI